ncbi:MAG: TonB-dependent receptor [Flavobacteriales bacterium]|nr:TonB-dependent receptor [Flavobacteriales bacterium]
MRALLLILFLLQLVALNAQSGCVRGVVQGTDGPVPFASVSLAGTTTGTAATADGRFMLDGIPTGEVTMELSAVGFLKRTMQVRVGASGCTDLGTVTLQASAAELEEMVVSGTLREVTRSNSPVPVQVLSPKLFRRNPVPSLLEATAMVNGVRPQVNCGVCNTGDIHINGLEGPYTLVLIDGMPIVSGLSTVYGLQGIPLSLIERVEVVKGPASSLYGSEAMGGLINVITKDATLAPDASADVMVSGWGEVNADLGMRVTRARARANLLVGVNAYHYDRPVDLNDDGFTDLALQERISIFSKLALRRPHRRTADLALRLVGEDRWGGQMNWTPAFAGSDSIYGETIRTRRWELIGRYHLPMSERVLLQVSMNGHAQDSWYGITPFNALQRVAFAQLLWDRTVGGRHHLLGGLAYRHTFYDDNTVATSSTGDLGSAPQRRPLPGLFLQDEWDLTTATTLLLGYRADHDRTHGWVSSPRVALKVAPNGRSTLRAGLGTGFRVVDLFTEEHAALTGARNVVVEETLLPERSWSATVDLRRQWPGERRTITADLNLFHTRFSNRILPDYTTDPDLIIYRNLAGYGISQGIGLDLEARLGQRFRVMAGATYMDVFVQEGAVREQQLFAPDWSGTFMAGIERVAGFGIDLTAQWYGPMRLPVQPNDFRPEMSPWYALANVQVRRKLGERWEVYGGVKNLLDFTPTDPLMRPFDPFDRHADDPVTNPHGHTFDTAYAFAPMQGRRWFAGLRWILER